jgi:ABC-2 type transport system ATP-binding protein
VRLASAVPGASGAADSAAPPVHIEGLCKRFPLRRSWLETILFPLRTEYLEALRDVSLQVPRGELFGLLGPNGAGKTTLFKILSALILPDRGTARVCGYDVTRQVNAVRSRLRPVVPDERSLMWRISARENLRLYAELQGLRGSARDQRVQEALEIVELADTGTRMVAKFSSGMKQRLLIARALLADPDVLLLDEPTRSLDPISARRLRSFLREEVVRKQGRTVLIATHNAEEALELCDRVGVLHQGRLIRTGAPERLTAELQDHQYRFVVDCAGWRELARRGATPRGLELAHAGDPEDGWIPLTANLPAGTAQVAAVIRELVESGVAVGPVEPVRLSLAELIERIVAAEAVVASPR